MSKDDIKLDFVGRKLATRGVAEREPQLLGTADLRKIILGAEQLRGPRGHEGPNGRRGRRGVKGEHGERGEPGKQGVGIVGARGPAGVSGRQGLAGPKGDKGDKGDAGKTPAHKWEGTRLSFEMPNGNFGRSVDLLGPAGGRGGAGRSVKETWQSIELQGQELVFVKNTAGPLGKETRVDLSPLAGGGFAGLGPWRSRTEIVAPPAAGQVRFNNANVELATEFYLHEINDDAEDLANFLNLLDAGDVLYMQDAGDSANFTVVEISSNVDSGAYRTFGIANIAQQGAALAQNTVVNFVATIAGGGAGSVVTGMTIDVANILTLTQTSGGNQTVDLSQFLTATTGDGIYLRLDTTNDPLTGDLTTQAVVPQTDQNAAITFGADNARPLSVHGRLGVFVGSSSGSGAGIPLNASGTRSFGANPAGIMGGNQAQGGSGTATHYLRGGAFKGVVCIGNAVAGGAGNALLRNNSGGSSLFGSAYTYGLGNATVEATTFGNFTAAYSYALGNDHLWSNRGSGSFLSGYSQGAGTVTAEITGQGSFGSWRPQASNASAIVNCNANGNGAFSQGFTLSARAGFTTGLQATGEGSFVQGSARSGVSVSANPIITASGVGSFAQGRANNGIITASNNGAFAQGSADGNSVILASGIGSFAHGEARSTNSITASGRGAFAVGTANTGPISASAANAFQFGPGVNALADSLQIGNAGIRFKGTAGAPAAPQNGDFWVNGGFIYARSNGVSIQIAGPGPLTN